MQLNVFSCLDRKGEEAEVNPENLTVFSKQKNVIIFLAAKICDFGRFVAINESDRTGERANLPSTECSQSPVTNLNIYYTTTKTEMCSLLQNVPYFKKVFDLRKNF